MNTPGDDEILSFWNRTAEGWDIQVGREGDSNRILNSDPVLWAFAGDVRGRKVLDVGCGTGYLSKQATDRGASVTGVDLSDRMIEIAFWTWRIHRGKPGRPKVPEEFRDLIRMLSRNNPRWGAPRIHGELLKLGIEITEPTVSKYMVRLRKPPSQPWRTFLQNHVHSLVSVDFFTVPTIRFQVLYVFLVLAHDRRRILPFNVTAHPTAEWTGQQLREAFPFEQIPRYLLRDHDGIFGSEFRKHAVSMGIKDVLYTPHSPW